jgi:lectin-like protein
MQQQVLQMRPLGATACGMRRAALCPTTPPRPPRPLLTTLIMNADAPTRPLAAPSRSAYTRTGVRLQRWIEHGLRPHLQLAGLGIALLGCGDTELARAPAPSPSALDARAAQVPLTPACVEGAVEPCSEVLGEHDGIVSCYEGTRTCQGGRWSACLDGQSYEVMRGEATASAAGLRPLAVSAASDCTDNPCNSFCREFNEAPAKGLVPDVDETAPPPTSWITGNLTDYPPEWVVIGNQEPCEVAGDCQFDTACTDPSPGSCSHSVCAAGEALAVGCNRCADSVCALNADCCASAPACAHDPCEVGIGGPLDPSCDSCVSAVCDAHPECCSVGWDEACVGYVAAECAPLGQSCSCPSGGAEAAGNCYVAGADTGDPFYGRDACAVFGDGWGLSEIADATENTVVTGLLNTKQIEEAWLGGVESTIDAWSWRTDNNPFFVNDPSGGALQPGYTYANWSAGEPALGASASGIAIGADGTWRGANIDSLLGYVCEGPKNRLGPRHATFNWGPECVALVEQTCGVSCPDAPPLGIGSCIARVPTETDETCATFDLSLGATCEASGLPQIPICNHGQAEAPAGLRLSYLPIGQMGSPAPDLTAAGDCVLTEAVPPGSCITLTDCPGLSADAAVVVNPVDAADNGSECRQDDNWTIYQPLPCRPAVCESHLLDAARVKADDCSIDLENPLTVDPTLASVRVGTSIPVPSCGLDEVRWGASCYFFSRDVATWDDAQNLCRERGSGWDLVALNSPAENGWVRSETDASADLQIGFNDKDTEGDHVWSNGSCRAFTAWDSSTSQPNNTPPGSEQCTRMTVAAGTGWEDKACNDDAHPYACEGPVRDARGGCASGQVSGPDGKCYAFERGGRTFDTARDRCLALGTGWQLASVDDETTNDFVTSLIGCSPTWLNNPPGAFSHWAVSESVDLSNPPFIDALGFWHAAADSEVRSTLCQGPATAAGAPELEQVANRAACTGAEQFYFEGNETAPESLHLCPQACEAAAAVAGRSIEVEIPCAPPPLPAIETEHTEVYGRDADDPEGPLCPGTTPQWDFLYYDAVTPGDSRIEFEVRTAGSIDELTANATSFLPVAQAHAAPIDTQKCESPSQGQCPIDLFHALGDDGRQQQVDILELMVRLVPGSKGEGPIVRDWKVRFSCPPAQ